MHFDDSSAADERLIDEIAVAMLGPFALDPEHVPGAQIAMRRDQAERALGIARAAVLARLKAQLEAMKLDEPGDHPGDVGYMDAIGHLEEWIEALKAESPS